MEDVLTKATADGVRIYALCTTNLVQEAAKKHGCSHLASAALGRAMNGALLLAATMKDNERISLRLKGDGPLGEVVADAEGSTVRGYVENPDAFLPLKNGKLDVGGGIGEGNIIVTRYLQNAEPFTGYCELQDGEIASDLTKYLYVSEQTPTSVALGVLVDKDGNVTAKIVWSSKNYDYMKVGDTKYDAVIEDEHSTFEIPVSCFDWAMAVKADTTAMSEAHEIDYTLTFDAASVAPLSK